MARQVSNRIVDAQSSPELHDHLITWFFMTHLFVLLSWFSSCPCPKSQSADRPIPSKQQW